MDDMRLFFKGKMGEERIGDFAGRESNEKRGLLHVPLSARHFLRKQGTS